MNYKLDRRGFLASAGASALAAGAFGAGPALAQDGRIRLLWWGSQPRADRTFKVADMFMEANPGTTIDGETAGWSDYWPRLATQVAGRNAPDVLQMDYRYIFEYARRGALADMNALRTDMPLEGFSDLTLQGGSVDGGLYGVSLGANSSAIMCNMTALTNAGVELPARFTFDDLKTMGATFSNADDVPYLTADESGYETAFENYMRQFGRPIYTADGQVGYSVEDVEGWFELWAELRSLGVAVPADMQALDQRQIETAMVTLGHAALSVAHTNQLVGFQAVSPNPIDMRPLPLISADATGGHYRKPSQFFSISESSKNKELAARFIDYFVTNPEAAMVLDVERGVPEASQIRDVVAPSLDATGQRAVEFIADLGDLVGDLPPPPPKGAGEIQQLMIRVSQEVGFGQRTPREGAEALHSESVAILERA